MAGENEIVVTLEAERETKNTMRFRELENEDGLPVLETVYIKKYTLKRLGNPKQIEITIRPL